MAKAWRNENARKINARREAGSKEPNARTQMRHRVQIKKEGSNWLLSGLMMHAGYMPAVPNAGTAEVPVTMGLARRISRAMSRWWTGKR